MHLTAVDAYPQTVWYNALQDAERYVNHPGKGSPAQWQPESGSSSAPRPDEDPARELLGRALAELPVNIGWVIKRTPDVDAVAECHLYALVLGTDIWAPVGLELWWARRTEKPILAYAADVSRTPAGQAFRQEHAFLDWKRYTDLPALRRLFLRDICRFLLLHSDRYGVTVVESETLRGLCGAA